MFCMQAFLSDSYKCLVVCGWSVRCSDSVSGDQKLPVLMDSMIY